ncbi:MAG: ABC transporter ATP-binding protein/permease [Phycisphaerae bacterium]|nr:ABC transporter ATP-binding protein/permease [Phycisphaerae bacterium]
MHKQSYIYAHDETRPPTRGVRALQFLGRTFFRNGYPWFRRSLWYMYPYRRRIGIALLCTIVIAVLWGGAIGMVMPGAKILLTEEGLHGWAYTSVGGDVIGARLIEQDSRLSIDGNALPKIVNVISAPENSPAAAAGLAGDDRILGIDGKIMPARDVLRRVANATPGEGGQPGEALNLLVLRDGQQRTVTAHAGEANWSSRLLLAIVSRVPEPKSSEDSYYIFIGLLAFALAISVVRAVFTFTQEYLIGSAIWMGVMDMRCENYDRVLHLPVTFFSQNVTDTTSRFVQDTNELANGQHALLGRTMVEPAKAIGSITLALILSWQLTLLALIAGPPAFWIIRRLSKKMHKASRKALEGWSTMLAVLNETLQGIRAVKAYTMEGAERRRFFRANRALLSQQVRKIRLDAATSPIVEILSIVTAMSAAVIAGYLVFYTKPFGVAEFHLDKTIFIGWMAACFAMFDPIRKLARVAMRFAESDAAGKRIFELQDAIPEPHVPKAPSLPRHSQSIEFRDVSFRYPNTTADTLANISLTVRAGQSIAVVGPNGSGKTTLVSLLPRLLEPTGGKILIDGHDIATTSTRSLRRQIALVSQDAVLFHATIAENIAYGLSRPREDDVLAASHRAFVDEFVREMPEGYQTMVGEHGATLSGGQKQRISIARAILRDPAIMIFDEAMSQVDADSEHRIHQAMQEFVKGRTTFTIAHRFATVLSADVIVVMADGKIADHGTHDQLLKRCELYRHLYHTQFADTGGNTKGTNVERA